MVAVTADNDGVVAPRDCLIMISFNDYSAGPNAEALARFLTKNNFPTFCTRIYCPANSGDWRDATEEGVASCKIYIPLVTKGWQMSKECQYETRLIRKRIADQNVKVIPVYYQDFDEAYDKTSTGHNYKFKWNDFQSVYRQKGDEGNWMANEEEDKWMKTILNLLAKEEDNSTSMENITAEKSGDTVNASKGVYQFKRNDFQSVYRQKGDEGNWMVNEEEDKWMKTILNLLAKEEDSSTSMENITAEKSGDTVNASKGVYQIKRNDFQSVYRQKGDEGNWMDNLVLAKEEIYKWMKTILNFLAKEKNNSSSMENRTAEKSGDTGNASKGVYTYDDLLKNSDCIERKYSVKIGNDNTIAVVPSSDIIKINLEETKFEKYIDARRKGQFVILPEELSAAKISLLGKTDCKKIHPLQFIAMTEAQIQAFTSKQASDYFKGEKKRAISQIIRCESGLRDVIHHFGTQHSKQSLKNRRDDDDSKMPSIGEDYSEYSKSSKAHVNYSQTPCEGVFHFRTEEYVWIRHRNGSISFGQVMNEQGTFAQLYQSILAKAALFYQWVLPKAKSFYQRARVKAELLYPRVKDDLFALRKKFHSKL
jgi:hypothetical protein